MRTPQWLWRLRSRLDRFRRAWRYATGTMTKDDAADIGYECVQRSGDYPLAYLTEDGMMETARIAYRDCPELAGLVHEACARVWQKWNGDTDLQSAAEDWAMDLIPEYAQRDGIQLVERDGTEDDEEAAA